MLPLELPREGRLAGGAGAPDQQVKVQLRHESVHGSVHGLLHLSSVRAPPATFPSSCVPSVRTVVDDNTSLRLEMVFFTLLPLFALVIVATTVAAPSCGPHSVPRAASRYCAIE